jgi:hypothetical protein
MPSLARLTLVEGAIHDINLSKLEQFACITLASKPLKVRNPRRPETGTKLAKSVKLTMPCRLRFLDQGCRAGREMRWAMRHS